MQSDTVKIMNVHVI